MTAQPKPLPPGLHFIATPIGAARDITLHALDILDAADVLAAEDTRSLRKLMELHGIAPRDRPVLAYHDHNGAEMRPRLIAALTAGKTVVYAPEAGTPLVADPGYRLARAAIDEGIAVHSAPGPSAVLAALTVSGLPTDRFAFLGFPPSQKAARRRFFEEAAAIPATLVFFESPKRINRTLGELRDSLGETRQAAVCRELTKRFEEVARAPLGALAARFGTRPPKGEVVLVVDRARADAGPAPGELEARLRVALREDSVKDAAARVAAELGLPRRQVYQAALRLEEDEE